MLIDLHTHSFVSDGTDSPAELMRAARDAGLDVVALTDHDTTGGWADAAAALPDGLTLVPGAEICCALRGVSLHLLAYLFDPEDEALRAEMSRAHDDRVPRAREIVRLLGEAGHPISWQDVEDQIEPGATVGRPHIADALVAAGVASSRDAAFADLLHNRGPFYVRHYAVDPVRAVQLVRGAGGVPVFAHPAASRRGRIVGDEVIAAMAAAGLGGLEVDHRDHPPEQRGRLRGLARDLGLLVTGSSDYHGDGKPNRLGENTTSPEAFAALVEQASGSDVVAA
ncbi:MAG: PHP domain-containing protein [Acidimicrobiales bacterium]